MLKYMVASLVCLAAWIATPAGAQVRAPDSGIYGGFGIGSTDNDLPGAIDSSDTGWKLFGGYQINRNFAVEGGYVDLGRVARPGAAFDSTALHVSGLAILPVNQQFSMFGKLGLARTETDVFGFGTRDNTDPAYGLGLRFDLNRQFGIRGEWERFRIDGRPVVGKSDTDLFSISGVVRFQ